jgi:hypothetical protein
MDRSVDVWSLPELGPSIKKKFGNPCMPTDLYVDLCFASSQWSSRVLPRIPRTCVSYCDRSKPVASTYFRISLSSHVIFLGSPMTACGVTADQTYDDVSVESPSVIKGNR